VSHASANNKVAPLLRRALRASLQRVEGADQSRPYANAGLVQSFAAQALSALEMYWYRDIYGPKVSPIPYR